MRAASNPSPQDDADVRTDPGSASTLSTGFLTYRPDIDGLRAIAVLSVVVYHAVPSWLPGGFVGVDVFFVISGFLITGILTGDALQGRFSLLRFYERRIRRIVPALLVVILATLIAGYFLLQPGDYRTLGDSAIWAIGFLANVFYWLNTGYFDTARETMPLLHTWSLAVEEQFYLVWPLVILVLVRWIGLRKPAAWALLGAALVASFALSVWQTEVNPQAAFYSPFTRAWELGLGAVLALLMTGQAYSRIPSWLLTVLGWIGVGLIAFAVLSLSSDMPFPSYNAAYPVLGSCCLIIAGVRAPAEGGPITALLSTAPMVFVGKISYSLYLWHWPIFVYFHHYSNGQAMTPMEAVVMIGVSIGLAVLSWRYIEQPLRHIDWSRAAIIGVGIGSSLLTAGVALLILANDGLPERVPASAKALADHRTMWDWPCPDKRRFDSVERPRCVLGVGWDEAKSHAVLWGDSHALHYAPLIDRVARRNGLSVFLFDSCAPYIDNEQVSRPRSNRPAYSEKCGKEHDEMMSFLQTDERVQLVLLASAWAVYPKTIQGPDETRSEEGGLALMQEGLTRVVDVVGSRGGRTLILSEIPRSNDNLVDCMRTRLGGLWRRTCDLDPTQIERADAERVLANVNAVIRNVADQRADVDMVDATLQLCEEERCSTMVNGEFLFRDTHHIRRNLLGETQDALIERLALEAAVLGDG